MAPELESPFGVEPEEELIDLDVARRLEREAGDWTATIPPHDAAPEGMNGAAAPRPLAFFRASDLASVPVPVQGWIVPGLIPAEVTTLFSGHGGTGKTTLIVQLLIALATGDHWAGRAVRAGPGLGVFAEDQHPAAHRLIASVCSALNVDLARLDSISGIASDELGDVLATPSRRDSNKILATSAFDQLRIRALDEKVVAITIDPAANVFDGDENNRNQVRQFVSMLNRLAAEIEGAVVLTSHPSQAGLRHDTGYSGSTAWHNSVRSLINLTAPKAEEDEDLDRGLRLLRHLKCNVGPLQDEMKLRWHHGLYVPEGSPTGMVAAIEKGVIETDFLAALDKATEQGLRVSTSRQGNFAPRDLRPFLTSKKYTQREMERAMQALLADGKLKLVDVGKSSKGARMLVRNINF